jgi:hypothetical protein
MVGKNLKDNGKRIGCLKIAGDSLYGNKQYLPQKRFWGKLTFAANLFAIAWLAFETLRY